MKIICKRLLLFLLFLPLLASAQSEEFYGPFSSWVNLKKIYNAKGDGITDDTKAFQKAFDEIGEPGHAPVLFIPNGTYRITSTLLMKTKKGIALYGEDPEKTIIKWDGKAGEKMFLLNGVSYSDYSRIKWDGNNKALAAYAHEWDTKVKYANSGSQHSDEIFINVQVGIKSGNNMDAEMSIRRCRFYNCTSTAVSLQGSNALDWWLWDCYFENCNVGVANNLPAFGAGNFQVYRCIFNRSVTADISLGNSNFFSFRDNISFNSGCFLKAAQFSNTSPLTLQNNLIISNTNNLAIDLFTKGNVLLINNTFITPDSGKNFVIRNVDYFKGTTPDITFIGNKFTAKNKLIENGGGRILETGTVAGIKMPLLPVIRPVAFAPVATYPVMEVVDSMKTELIQTLINGLAKKNKKAIVHFKYGNYHLTNALSIPSSAPLILLGDGLQTFIDYKKPVDSVADAVIKIAAPSKSIIKSLWILGNPKTDGVLVYDDDKTGNSIYGNQLMLFNGQKTNLWVNGFMNTSFRFENFQHNYSYKGTSIKMVGRDASTNSLLRVFGGESAVNDNSYEVSNGGRILIYDTWYEGSSRQFISLKGNGAFYLNGAKIAVFGETPADPFIKVDSFKGKVVIAQAIYNSPKKKIFFNNNLNAAGFLTIGTLSWTDSTNKFYEINDRSRSFSMYNNRFNTGKGSYPLDHIGDTSRTFINSMLATILENSVKADNPFTKKSQLVFDRVMIDGSGNNLRIERIPANKK